MKDIDFDELDRAVSSVLGQTAQPNDGKEADTSVSPSAAVPESTATKKPPEPVVETKKEAPTPPAAAVVPKRRGKFMDVMHPSATVGPQSRVKPVLTERGPVTLRPLSPGLSEEKEKNPEPTVTVKESVVEHNAEPIAALDESHSLIGAEPAPVENPLETAETTTEEKPAPVSDEESDKTKEKSLGAAAFDADLDNIVNNTVDAKAEVGIAGVPLPTDTEEEATPAAPVSTLGQTTPFLADTKVDKRPLGGFGGNVGETTETGAQAPDSNPQVASGVSLPRELQSDVVQAESAQEDSTSAAHSGKLYATKMSAATELEDDGRVEGHPLFDTSTYHEPIAAVHKSSVPAWLKWLLGLMICLLLGAGVGYFLFTVGF